MAQIRRETEQTHFTILPNSLLRDSRLSYRAAGLLARLLSEPPETTINTARLQAERPGKEGRDAILRALRELEAAGYLTRPRRQGPGGRWRTEWVVSSRSLPEDLTTPLHLPRTLALLTHPEPPLLAGRGDPIAWPASEPPPVDEGTPRWG